MPEGNVNRGARVEDRDLDAVPILGPIQFDVAEPPARLLLGDPLEFRDLRVTQLERLELGVRPNECVGDATLLLLDDRIARLGLELVRVLRVTCGIESWPRPKEAEVVAHGGVALRRTSLSV